MTYGYTSSEPTLTVNLTPEQQRAGRMLAKRLGFVQSRGPAAGNQGSLSQLVAAIGEHASDRGIRATAAALKWTLDITPAPRYQTHSNLLIDSALIPLLQSVAKAAGHVRATGPKARIGQGSTNALVASIAQAAVDGLDDATRRLQWIVPAKSRPPARSQRQS